MPIQLLVLGGVILGALIDKKNRWRGAFIGNLAGGVIVTVTSLAMQNVALAQELEEEEANDLLQGG
jgi:Na+-transporting NADH:ubiquinone oxidoreductase subunit NqrB